MVFVKKHIPLKTRILFHFRSVQTKTEAIMYYARLSYLVFFIQSCIAGLFLTIKSRSAKL